MRKKTLVIAAAGTLALILFLVFSFLQRPESGGNEGIDIFHQALDLIREEYVRPVNPADIIPPALSSFFKALHPASAYLTRARARVYRALSVPGEICSAGIFGHLRDDEFLITRIQPGSAADRAGILPGECITAIDDLDFNTLGYWQILTRLQSLTPRDIRLSIGKPGNNSNPREINLTTFRTACPSPVPLGKGLYYLPLLRFTRSEWNRLKNFLQDPKPAGLVLDLRGYLGGDFDSFREISGLLLSREIPLTLVTRTHSETVQMGRIQPDRPFVAGLIDASTVMYSELLAHLLDLDGAVTLGTATGGLLALMRELPLEDGSLALFPTGEYRLAERELSGHPLEPRIQLSELHLPEQAEQLLALLER